MKIVVIGGGSTYTPELIKGLIARNTALNLREVWLVDPDAERLQIVGSFAQRMVSHANAGFRVELTADRRLALEGADYVVTQFRVAGSRRVTMTNCLDDGIVLSGRRRPASAGLPRRCAPFRWRSTLRAICAQSHRRRSCSISPTRQVLSPRRWRAMAAYR
jgi:hypothetical protein